ncbi:MAG: signal peptidase II [Candidatus Omnitrophica bacterium]|nr:signal peptidase II [Candidatus Omnitrophota bacterium]
MRILFCVAGIVLLCDQFTKFLAVSFLKSKSSIVVIPYVFQLSFVENTGIAFGFFQGHPKVWTWIISASVLCLLACSNLFRKQVLWRRIAYGFILGGAMGNWIDRLRFDHVIDFLDFHIWPVFNVADSFITMGVFSFIWFSLNGK